MTSRRWSLVVVVLAVLVVFAQIVWAHHFRAGYVGEWDENGYTAIAVHQTHALRHDGPISFARAVLGQDTQAPLVPALAVPFQLAFGASIISALLVPALFLAASLVVTFLLARRFVSPPWAVLAGVLVATAPLATDFARLVHFSVPAMTLYTAALFALVRSDGLTDRRWAVGAGALLGLTVLSRTMTVAFAPGFVAAAVVLVLRPHARRARAVNLVLLGAAAALVAGVWYAPNLRSVGHYLLHFGYGMESEQYGPSRTPFSLDFWTREISNVANHLYLPLFAVLAVAVVAWLVTRSRVTPWRVAVTSDAAVLAVAVLEGYAALTSSRNVGTAFALPLVPSVVVLGVMAAASLPAPRVRLAFASMLVATALLDFVTKSGLPPGIHPRTVDLPVLHRVTVVDGRSLITSEVAAAGYAVPSDPTRRLPARHRQWPVVARRVVTWLDEHRSELRRSDGDAITLGVGADDLLLPNTAYNLASQQWADGRVVASWLRPFPDDSVAGYARRLAADRVSAIVTSPGQPASTFRPDNVEAAARRLGYRVATQFALPDGRPLRLWTPE